MTVVYDTATKQARMVATRDECADGTLELRTTGDVVLAIFGLSATGGTVTSGVWTLVFDNNTVSAIAAGTATKAVIKNSGGTERVTGLTVGTSGTDIVLSDNVIANGQSVQLTSATNTHA